MLNKLTAPAAAPRNAKVADRTVQGIGAMNAMTTDLADALQEPDRRNAGARRSARPTPSDLMVDFDLFLNPDGTRRAAATIDCGLRGTGRSNPYTRAAAEAAQRAIYQCQPYKLPRRHATTNGARSIRSLRSAQDDPVIGDRSHASLAEWS